MNNSIISINKQNTSFIVKTADFILTPLRICLGADKKTNSFAMRFFCGLASIVIYPQILPLFLIAVGIKWLNKPQSQKTITPCDHKHCHRKELLDVYQEIIKILEATDKVSGKNSTKSIDFVKNKITNLNNCENRKELSQAYTTVLKFFEEIKKIKPEFEATELVDSLKKRIATLN